MISLKITRKQTEKRLQVQQFLFDLAFDFIDVTPSEIDNVIVENLQSIVEYTGADRCYIYTFADQNTQFILTHEFNKIDITAKIRGHDRIDHDDFAWLIKPLLDNQPVSIPKVAKLPDAARSIKAILEAEKIKSALLCPIYSRGKVVGTIGLDCVKNMCNFSDEIEELLTNSGKIFAGAINRRDTVRTGIRIEQKFRTMFSEFEDVVFISTPDGRLMEINPAGAKLFGYDSVRDMLNRDIKDLYFDPEDRGKYLQAIKAIGQVKEYQLILKDKDGKKIHVLETSMALRDDKGDIIAYQGILRDITEKRQLEQQLFQAKKMESIGMLAGGVAHDFNNILTTISGYAELMMLDMDKTNPQYKDADNILQGVKRAEDLIRQLLAFGRRQMIEPRIIDINKVISELHSMLKRLIPEDIAFDLKLKDHLSYIKADPVQIQQTLVNLVVNAGYAVKKKENKSKGKSIIIYTDQIDVTKETVKRYPGLREGNYILIAVEDNGIGMDEDTKQHIFEPFFSTKKEGEGTGLGLATVYGIVKQNNGNIYIDSQPGNGAAFKIFWPSSDAQYRDETRIDNQIVYKEHSETILFVEDDKNVCELARKALTSFGYKVITAENGKVALEKVNKDFLSNKIDLVISDIVMPEMGGEELANALRDLNPTLRILLCSGFTDSRVAMKDIQKKNGFYFLPKPYTIKKLEQTIREIISKPV